MIVLKTIVAQLPVGAAPPAPLVMRTVTPLLVAGIHVDARTEPLNACLESLSEVLGRFGDLVAAHHDEIQAAAMAVLRGGKPTSRKRAIHCLGMYALVIVLCTPTHRQPVGAPPCGEAGRNDGHDADAARASQQQRRPYQGIHPGCGSHQVGGFDCLVLRDACVMLGNGN